MVLLYIGVSIKIIYTQYFIQKSTTDFLQTLMFQWQMIHLDKFIYTV